MASVHLTTPISPQTQLPVDNRELNQSKNSSQSFPLLEIIVNVFCLVLYVADIVTDLILGTQYVMSGHLEWGMLTISLCVVPLILSQLISLRWHKADDTPVTLKTIVLHSCLLGIIQRYFIILRLLLKSQKEKDLTNHMLNHHQSDICLLRLFESFLESAPQLLLQLYVIHELGSWQPWTVISALASLVSLSWGITSYTRTMRNIREDKARISFIGMFLQASWRIGTVLARMIALLICASVLHTWFIFAMAIHWLGMTLWIVRQHTDLCSTVWEERVYNAVVGVIYCFCFFNLKEGKSRHRASVFYTVIAAENVACLMVFMRFSQSHSKDEWLETAAPILIVMGSLVGHTSQLIYYRWFHPAGPIKIDPTSVVMVTTDPPNSEITPPANPSTTLRTLKYIHPLHKFSGVSLPSLPADPIEEVDRLQRTDSRMAVINETGSLIGDVMDLAATELTIPTGATRILGGFLSDSKLLPLINTKDRNESMLRSSKSDGHMSEAPHENLQKQLQEPLVVAARNVDEPLGEVTSVCSSVHDYENLATININRCPDWGVRHWSTYSDIEGSCHDSSICRERDPLDSSLTSGASSSSVIDTTRISIQEAISQLKSLAVRGFNVYQPSCPVPPTEPDLYECIWQLEQQPSIENDPGVVLVPANLIKPCPTQGYNLSTITEESETTSVASESAQSKSTDSKSALVSTVDAIMDASLVSQPSPDDTDHLTYVEVNFLSKLAARPRRHFSILREKFQSARSDKENPPSIKKRGDCASSRSCSPLRQRTLSPNSRIFSA